MREEGEKGETDDEKPHREKRERGTDAEAGREVEAERKAETD